MKKYQLKTSAFKILDLLPSKFGFKIYSAIQNLIIKDVSFYIKPNLNSFKKIQSILNEHKIVLSNANILEIGSGRFPIMPVFFRTHLSINRFYTYDISFHYTQKRINDTLSYLQSDDYEILTSNHLNLPSFISYFPNRDILKEKINDKHIDFVFSRFVLEHLTPEYISDLHFKLYENLPNSAYIIHLISPSDHRAFGNSNLSIYDFLKYSKKEWNAKQTKFNYHNRLRLPDYIKIFTEAGFKIEYLEHDKVDPASKKYKMFKKLNIHKDFAGFNENDLLAGSIVVLLKKISDSRD